MVYHERVDGYRYKRCNVCESFGGPGSKSDWLAVLRTHETQINNSIRLLLMMVENGTSTLDEPSFKKRPAMLKLRSTVLAKDMVSHARQIGVNAASPSEMSCPRSRRHEVKLRPPAS